VTSVEYEGSVFLVHLETRSGSACILAHHGADAPSQGDEITVNWDSEATHLFSKTSGQRIQSS
jgi:sn-glycerol 3-phosphate transport system ATP-binding protein